MTNEERVTKHMQLQQAARQVQRGLDDRIGLHDREAYATIADALTEMATTAAELAKQ